MGCCGGTTDGQGARGCCGPAEGMAPEEEETNRLSRILMGLFLILLMLGSYLAFAFR